MWISSAFDSGNIRVLACDGNTARLEIRPDPGTDFLHWFHFRCVAEPHQRYAFRLANAGKGRAIGGWREYRAVASYDRRTWFRLPTTFDGESLSFTIDAIYPV